MNIISKTITSIVIFLVSYSISNACSNILITKGASKDGSVIVTYAADAFSLYGELYHTPAGIFPKGSKLKISEWDTGKYLGEIDQVLKTYSTMGNMNEHQLIITETTFGGRSELADSTGIMDYGSLIYVTLQRAKTAREAIEVMTNLVEEYGFYSGGESFSIADKNEVWIMEMIGKGVKLNKKGVNVNRGANWVAIKIPDGYVCAHANHSRITTFPLNDPENCLYNKDIIKFAKNEGYFNGKDEEFSFTDAFAPADFFALRACEARVWSAFNIMGKGMIGDTTALSYIEYAKGDTTAQRMPLYVKPAEKLGVKEAADIMRDHYENTPLDMRNDIGAGGFELPYRWSSLTFEYEGERYLKERAIATQQTGFWLVGQARAWLPDEIGGILWFGVDDAATSCLTPIYTSAVRVPECFRVGNGNMLTYSPTSAFWLFNRVAQFAYLRYNQIAPEVQETATAHEFGALQIIPTVDKDALRKYNENPEGVKEYLTTWNEKFADRMFKKWQELDSHLLVKYMDGCIKQQNADGTFKENGNGKNIPARATTPGYNENWKKNVVRDAGDRLIIKVVKKEEPTETTAKKETKEAVAEEVSKEGTNIEETATEETATIENSK